MSDIKTDASRHDVTRRRIRLAALLFLIDSVLVFVIVPLYVSLASDVLYAGTWWPTVLSVLRQAVEVAAFFISYAYLISLGSSHGVRALAGTLPISAGAAVYRYVANLLFSYVREGAPAGDEVLWDILMSAVIPVLLEWVQLGIVALLCVLILKHREQAVPTARVSPTVSSKNPERNCILAAAGVVSAARVLSRVVYDIRYGAPSNLSDALWMTAYYSADVLIGVLGYFLMRLIVSRLKKASLPVSPCNSCQTK